ncbi:hypothetical protein PBY51_002434 [Eleginops maclovinus]|uniref:Uncharacterized protein n=1 Tax=Eleginops maclovinus TaxID=56733 RepID=A0AAN8AD36_ELEMC|nr:hypothetical protein PBY51_002434 [Eleginops maclovinus]
MILASSAYIGPQPCRLLLIGGSSPRPSARLRLSGGALRLDPRLQACLALWKGCCEGSKIFVKITENQHLKK